MWQLNISLKEIKIRVINKVQKYIYGWNNTEIEHLDRSIADFITPRLLAFKKMKICPPHLCEDDWESILDEMIWSFTYLQDRSEYIKLFIDKKDLIEEEEKYLQGMRLFSVYCNFLFKTEII